MDSKKWYASKTLWANGLAFIALILQGAFGWVVSPEYQVAILGLVNIILRAVTKTAIEW